MTMTAERLPVADPSQDERRSQCWSGLPRAEYDSLEAWNASLLKIVHSKTLAHAWAAYRDPIAPAQADSAAFRLGNLLHEALLEPDHFAQVVPTATSTRTKAYAEEQAEAQAKGQRLVAKDEYDTVQDMGDAIRAVPALAQLFHPELQPLNELTLAWSDHKTGERCKARLDAVRWCGDHIRVLDLKTTVCAGADDFGKSVANFGYLLQAAFYADGVFHAKQELAPLFGVEHERLIGVPIVFEFVCVEKVYPFAVARYFCAEKHIAMGRKQYRSALDSVHCAAKTQHWPAYPTEPQPLSLPGWFRP